MVNKEPQAAWRLTCGYRPFKRDPIALNPGETSACGLEGTN
jgi:hypothetical protein